MLFNVDKCKVMHIGHGNPRVKYNLDGKNLQEVELEKDLGIIIDSSAKPSRQYVCRSS